MTELLQITTTLGTRHEADGIAAELVERRLAACAQVNGPILSAYHWQGNVEKSEEWLCTAKTSRDKFPDIEEFFRQRHPYDVPELIATPVVIGSQAYLHWLRQELEEGREEKGSEQQRSEQQEN